jgi:ABC-2 type transport system permease protein
MNAFFRLLRWELRDLQRSRRAGLLCGGLFFAALISVWLGTEKLARHRAEVAALPSHYAAQMETIAQRFTPTGEAGYIAYYTFFPTVDPLTPLGALSVGVRDLTPDVVWVRLLGLEGQLYEADLGNPALQALGVFDFAFVLSVLAPLALLILTHDMLTADRDAGRLPLLTAQAGSLRRLLAARILARALALLIALTSALVLAVISLRAPLDAALMRWLGAAGAQLACWTGLAALIAVFARSTASSLTAALTIWIATAVLAPASLNLFLATAYPVKEGLELTVRQRQAIHSAWDKPRDETMEAFFAHNPDWSGTPAVTGRFAWRWYYAMHQVGDESVAAESRAYRENLRARQAVTARLAWLAPAAYGQLLLNTRAGTDLDAHLAYLDRVRAFHAGLRAYFYPLVFAERSLTPAEYAEFPHFQVTPVSPSPQQPAVWPLLAIAFVSGAVATRKLRKIPLF